MPGCGEIRLFRIRAYPSFVITGLDPVIHVSGVPLAGEDVGTGIKSGHDRKNGLYPLNCRRSMHILRKEQKMNIKREMTIYLL